MLEFRTISWRVLASCAALAAMSVNFLGCSADSGSISGGSGGTSSSVTSINVNKFQNLNEADWIVDTGTNGLMTTNTTVNLQGFCPRGVSVIKVKVNGVDSGVTAPCTNQAWSWGKPAIGVDGNYTFFIYGVNTFGIDMTDIAYTRVVVIDTTPPPVPNVSTVTPSGGGGVATANGGSVTFNNVDGTVTISGTTSADVHNMSANSAGSFGTESGGTFSFTTTLTAGETRSIQFTAYDLLQNASAAATITVSYIPPLAPSLPYTVYPISGSPTSAGVNLRSANIGTVGANATTTSGGFTLSTGFSQFFNVTEQ
jgi:hypothetical protein